MEIEQLIKQVDWLDEERRKDKTRIAVLEERINALEGNIPLLSHQIKEIEGSITSLSNTITRINHFEEGLIQQRIEFKQTLDDLERQIKKRDEESQKLRFVEMRGIDTSLVELRKELEAFPEIKRQIKARIDEELRLSKIIEEVRARIEVIRRSDDEYTRSFRLLDDGRRQDAKKINDVAGELSAIRKRVDENRGRIELLTTSTKKVETRLGEIAVVEAERREGVDAFLEKQSLYQVERERTWKEWQARFELIETQTSDIESSLQALDTTHRAIKRTQQFVEELGQKVDRRINEITEIQRLSEERFRQEWVTFKADDQKRWTNYTLTVDEQRSEAQRQFDRLSERIIQLDDSIRLIQDLTRQMNELSEKRLQTLLATTHEWVANFERTLGRNR